METGTALARAMSHVLRAEHYKVSNNLVTRRAKDTDEGRGFPCSRKRLLKGPLPKYFE